MKAAVLGLLGCCGSLALTPDQVYQRLNSRNDVSFAVHSSHYFADKYRGSLLQDYPMRNRPAAISNITLSDLPDAFDFRETYSGCASPLTIFDQGSCGGCWAFSVAATLSDRFCMAGVDVVLSAQDLINCVQGSSKGCNGGFTEDAFDYAADDGVKLNSCVPFTGYDDSCWDTCSKTGDDGDAALYYTTNWGTYLSSDETKIKSELVAHGSISAVFEVFEDFFQYSSGVYKHLEGGYAGLHAVVMVGYGTEAGQDYWIVKNSWGADFGESGIARGLQVNGCNFEGGLTIATPKV